MNELPDLAYFRPVPALIFAQSRINLFLFFVCVMNGLWDPSNDFGCINLAKKTNFRTLSHLVSILGCKAKQRVMLVMHCFALLSHDL